MNHKFCIKCGNVINSNAQFCPICGQAQDNNMFNAQQSTMVNQQPYNNVGVNVTAQKKVLFSESVCNYFTKMFSVEGTASRAEFWYGAIMYLILSVSILAYMIYASFHMEFKMFEYTNRFYIILFFDIFMGLLVALSVIALISSGARRLHDTGKSAHYLWMYLIPFVGYILTIVFLCAPTQSINNRYKDAKITNGQKVGMNIFYVLYTLLSVSILSLYAWILNI
ncbi:hypothetical protein AKUA2003_01050 [Apilactobacillus kunkeei]|nr:hypothetical protein AKUA2003_01050 [Apilactobacillus kunkeei]CAI2554781.1 hypothetical protein AKUA1001_01040 [Apilactobacillus kunkeei]CAI2801056.1 hypothetical protein AKUA2002_01050 [Apilactobacillus kunkeei]